MDHLVYCDDKAKVLDKILSGEKTMVVRGASGRKIPHSRVFEGETLYFLQKGTTEIAAKATVAAVENYVKLTDDETQRILAEHQPQLALTEAQKVRWHKKALCLVAFRDVEAIDPPLPFDRQSNMDDWIILEQIADAVVGTSKPYHYDHAKLK